MPLDGTIGGLVGRLDVLRIECATPGRQGGYHVARLVAEFGRDARLTDFLHAHARLPAEKPAGRDAGLRRCDAGSGAATLIDCETCCGRLPRKKLTLASKMQRNNRR
jgi:hypothetical protein